LKGSELTIVIYCICLNLELTCSILNYELILDGTIGVNRKIPYSSFGRETSISLNGYPTTMIKQDSQVYLTHPSHSRIQLKHALCHSFSRSSIHPSPIQHPKCVRFKRNLIQFPLKKLYSSIQTTTKALRSILRFNHYACRYKTSNLKLGMPKTKHRLGALDSGATHIYLPDDFVGTDHQATSNGMVVACANDATMQAKSTDKLDLPRLPPPARECHKFSEITMPLVSVGKLCDNDLYVTFSGTNVVVTDKKPTTKGNIVMEGQRKSPDGLYFVPLTTDDMLSTTHSPPRVCNVSIVSTPRMIKSPVSQPRVIKSTPDCKVTAVTPSNVCNVSPVISSGIAASVYEVQTVSALINFYHMTLCSPNINEWIKFINKNWFRSFPGLTATRVRKHYTKKEQTTLGNQKWLAKISEQQPQF
jgi:hypothetical protein